MRSNLRFINQSGKYIEERMLTPDRPAKMYHFFVTGHGYFPIDMLRMDRAWPASESDANKMHGLNKERRTVELRSLNEPAIGRWTSFDWVVTSYEVIPEPDPKQMDMTAAAVEADSAH